MCLFKFVPLLCLALCPFHAFSQVIGAYSSDMQQPALTTPASKTPADQRCSLSGQITSSITGERVKKANVSLRLLTDKATEEKQEGYTATSDTDGIFKFQGIEPGRYMLSGSHQGYLNTEFGKKSYFDPGEVLSFKPSDSKSGLILALIPKGKISGKIVDEDGDPIAGVMVSALQTAWMNGKQRQIPAGMQQSDDLGEFRLSNLAPGRYMVMAKKVAPPGLPAVTATTNEDAQPVKTYYPQAAGISMATPLEVQAGQEMAGINIQLLTTKTHHVRGTIIGDIGKAEVTELTLTVADEDDLFSFFSGLGAQIKKDRTFDIAGVAPGAHTLMLSDLRNGLNRLASQTIEVGSGDVDGVSLQTVSPGSIRGHLIVEGEPPAGASKVNPAGVHPFIMGEELMMPPQFTLKDDGSLSIEPVAPGKYHLQMQAPAGTYIKAVLYRKQDVTGQEFDLTQNTSGDLDIVLRYGPAQVGGTVKLTQDSTVPSPTEVVLIPDAQTTDYLFVETGESDQNGSFTISNVRPGSYKAVALDRIDQMQLQNPDLLKQLLSLGTAVDVKENEKKQIALERVPSADLQALFAKLGIELK